MNIPLCRADIHEEDINRVADCLRSGWVTTGPITASFEEAFAQYKGINKEQALAVSSCTAALHLSLLGAGIGPGDEVITTAMTFSATVHEIIHVGAAPVLVDIDSESWNMNACLIKQAITPKTKAILVVHYAGRPCEMDAIMAIAEAHNLKVIEDCAHAIESEFRGQAIGTSGDFAAFSFYASKNLTTAEGGMVVAKNPANINNIRIMSLHGMDRDAWARGKDNKFSYLVVSEGFKYNLSDVHAAIGIGQLGRLEKNWQKRADVWSEYIAAFKNFPLQMPAALDAIVGRHAYHIFTMRVLNGDRDALMAHLRNQGIASSIHYPLIPIHPYFQHQFGWQPDDWPVANAYANDTITLPLFPGMMDAERTHIISTVSNFFSRQR